MMEQKDQETSLLFRTAAWMWIAYLISLLLIDLAIYQGKLNTSVLGYYGINFIPALVFLGFTFTRFLKNPGRPVTIMMIVLLSAVPITVNYLFDLKLPPAPLSNLEGMALRQLPVLIIGLVVVAWNYSLKATIIFSFSVNIFELLFVYGLNRLEDPRFIAFFSIIIIRLVCFLVVGVFINQLIRYARTQKESLRTANLELTHYASTLESLTIHRERNRISRELHDTVVHSLSGLSVQLETIKAYWNVDPEMGKKLLDQSLELTRSGLQETRLALKALRATALEDLGLFEAIRQLAHAASDRGKLKIHVELSDQPPYFSPDVEQCVYRIVQEALENVIHHANAREVSIQLKSLNHDLEVLIQDDGIGFNLDAGLPAGHFGITGMKERAKVSGGELVILSKPNQGTKISLLIKGSVK